jgi:hypothetical protein
MTDEKKKEQPQRPPDRDRAPNRDRDPRPLREERDYERSTRIEPDRPWERK